MKLCDTCIYRNNVEQLKPCIIYRDDCEFYEKERGDMTREEAIEQLEKAYKECVDLGQTCGKDSVFWKRAEAIKVAIKALEQEPIAQERYEDLCEYFGDAKDILKNRDDFKAWLGRVKWHIHKAEELYEKYEQEPCGDAISREDLEKCKELMTDVNGDTVYAVKMSDIRQLPSVNPQEPKTGHWIPRNSFLLQYKCSECEWDSEKYNYCPNCGAKMFEPQESEE